MQRRKEPILAGLDGLASGAWQFSLDFVQLSTRRAQPLAFALSRISQFCKLGLPKEG